MIFVSVGMQMPFDRLCQAVDAWAGDNGRDDVFMQIGETDWRPSNVEYTELIDPSSFKARVRESTLLVMGPGRYRFRDYVILGAPFAVITWLVTTIALPLLMPLR